LNFYFNSNYPSLDHSGSQRTASTSSGGGEEPLMSQEQAQLFYGAQLFKTWSAKAWHAEAAASAFRPFARDPPPHFASHLLAPNQYDKITHPKAAHKQGRDI
jgi:hypothetical protein